MNRSPRVAVVVDPTLRYPLSGDVRSYLDPAGPVYRAVAGLLAELGAPGLRGVVEPGDRVMIKPNWVSDKHPGGDEYLYANITHGAVLAALADMAMARAGEDGEVIVGEVTTQEANFARICSLTGMWQVAAALETKHGRSLEIMDLRSQVARMGADGLVRGLRQGPGIGHDGYPFGDPTGYVYFDLGSQSEHAPQDQLAHLLRVTDYTFTAEMKEAQANETTREHMPGRHRYCIPRMVLSSDAFICAPKFKTHVKAGITLALKNLIGINARKALIPHRKAGSTSQGGDEWPDLEAAAASGELSPELASNLAAVRASRDANWFGNDTLWRTILDLNKILRYGGSDGSLGRTPRRRYLAVVDGLEGSDGPGPTQGRWRRDGVLLAGTDPVAVDTIGAALMGFDWRAFPHIARAYGIDPALRLVDGRADDIEVHCAIDAYRNWQTLRRANTLAYEAAPGWVTRVELG
jgi:uncharacterized protein (DUF362 family)